MKKKKNVTRVAPGTPQDVVDFATSQIFSPATKIQPVPAGAPRHSLQQVLAELHDSEINGGVQTFGFSGLLVWVGDELNGFEVEATLSRGDAAWTDDAAIAHWLHETAIGLYPDSAYARAHRP